jgi:hypothetical protein
LGYVGVANKGIAISIDRLEELYEALIRDGLHSISNGEI